MARNEKTLDNGITYYGIATYEDVNYKADNEIFDSETYYLKKCLTKEVAATKNVIRYTGSATDNKALLKYKDISFAQNTIDVEIINNSYDYYFTGLEVTITYSLSTSEAGWPYTENTYIGQVSKETKTKQIIDHRDKWPMSVHTSSELSLSINIKGYITPQDPYYNVSGMYVVFDVETLTGAIKTGKTITLMGKVNSVGGFNFTQTLKEGLIISLINNKITYTLQEPKNVTNFWPTTATKLRFTYVSA